MTEFQLEMNWNMEPNESFFFRFDWNLWVFHRQQLKYCAATTSLTVDNNNTYSSGKYSISEIVRLRKYASGLAEGIEPEFVSAHNKQINDQ